MKAPAQPAAKYRAIIESLTEVPPPAPLSKEERREVQRLMADNEWKREEAEEEVLSKRPGDEEDEDREYVQQAALRHKSYLPFVEAGLMTVYEAVREVGANRSADGRGQERT